MKIWTKVAGLSATVLYASGALAIQIDQVEFKEGVIEIKGEGLKGYDQELKKDPPELVLTFSDATISKKAIKSVDIASSKSNIMQFSAYPLAGPIPQARIVIDFKKAGAHVIEGSDRRLVVRINESVPSVRTPVVRAEIERTSVKTVSSVEETDSGEITPASTDPVDVAAASLEKKFTGTPITLKLKDAEVHEVLRLISDASGFNIVVHPSVSGRLTLSLDRVPWDQALEVVLTTLKLGAERSQSVLRVMPREMLIAEKQAELEAKKISSSTAPRITRVFPVSYADLAQLSGILTSFANSQNSGPGASGVPSTIIVDQNTQSMIVRDTAENVERIRKMIQLLDVQTPQVMIEGKVIEASSDFTKDINGNFTLGSSRYGFAFNGPNALLGTPNIASTAGAYGGVGTGAFRAAEAFTISNSPVALGAFLSIQEKENKAKVVSSPRTVVLSGKTATISQTKAIGVVNNSTTPTGGSIPVISVAQADTKLTVTPRVTNDGSVFMKLDLNRSVLNLTNAQAPATEPRSMQTEVIVDSGSTLVIGGVMNLDESHLEQGFPILRKLPIVGWLFGQEKDTNLKSEVMFFVTPRVLNPRKSGISGADEASVPSAGL